MYLIVVVEYKDAILTLEQNI